MPIYEYLCQACGNKTEVMQKTTDPALSNCPACGKSELKKIVSAAGFHLKGTGWYATDFKDKPVEKKTTETKSEAKTETAIPSVPEKSSTEDKK